MESIFPIGRHDKTMLSKIIIIIYRSGVRGILVRINNNPINISLMPRRLRMPCLGMRRGHGESIR